MAPISLSGVLFKGSASTPMLASNCATLKRMIMTPNDPTTPVGLMTMRSAGAITQYPPLAAMLPTLAKESFPLCMSVMMDALKRTHHLKHQGRQQLGLFLKGIGLPLEEAMRFWRTEMAAVAPGDAFDKQYAYNIRHNYGKEGKRADYTPHSCIKVISGIPGPGQVHGCPFRVLSEEDLRTSLGKLSLADPMRIEQAVTKAKEGHYQLACGKVWEGQHGCACDGINHPNQYYEQSRKVLVGEAAEEEKVAKVAKVEAATTNP